MIWKFLTIEQDWYNKDALGQHTRDVYVCMGHKVTPEEFTLTVQGRKKMKIGHKTFKIPARAWDAIELKL